MLWGFIRAYMPGATPESAPFLAKLVDYAIAYYRDFVAAKKIFREATPAEFVALQDLSTRLKDGAYKEFPGETLAEKLQNLVYAVGKEQKFAPLKAWFDCLYQVLLGQTEGPRFGGFIALYGVDKTAGLIDAALARK
jgi:lysyl-tRNA synthetase class 1